MKEKTISSPNEEITSLNLHPLAEVSEKDKKKQKDYEKRFAKFMPELELLQTKYKIKLLQVPARIIYYDTKYEKNK